MYRVNPDRQRRYLARTTSDVVDEAFDPLDSHMEERFNLWFEDFRKRMKTKHGQNLSEIISMSSDRSFTTGKINVRLEARTFY